MNKSESVAALAGALSKAQGRIEGAAKTSENPFFHSKYADLSAVWDACREPLSANGLSIVQTLDSFEAGVYVETTLLHSSGEWISGRQAIKPVDDKPQSWGSAITYARRYGLAAIVGVAPEDDDGNEASGKPKVNTQAAADYVAKEKIAQGLERVKGESESRKKVESLPEGEQVIRGVLTSISKEMPAKNGKPFVTVEIGGYKMNIFEKSTFQGKKLGEPSPLQKLLNQPVACIVKRDGKYLNFVAIERDEIQIKDEPEDPFALTEPPPEDEGLPF